MTLSIFTAFTLYFFILIAIGVMTHRKAKSAAEYTTGSRSLNFYVTALSAHASDMSNWLFMAYPAMIITMGGSAVWTALGLLMGMWANWQFVAPRLRTETARLGATTLASYFARRYNDHSGLLQTVGALFSLLFFSVYVSAGLTGIGLVFHTLFNIQPLVGMTIGITVILAYTLIGGYRAICWIDLFQALFLMVCLVVVPLVALKGAGPLPSFSLFSGSGTTKLALSTFFGWGLGYFGQTHILNKFTGIEKAEDLRKAKYLGLAWQTICFAAATLVGFIALPYLKTLADPELCFLLMVKHLFTPFIGGLILCATFAATISTVDSQLLVLVGVLTEDVYKRFKKEEVPPQKSLWVSRGLTLAVALLAFFVAATSHQSVGRLVLFSWSGLGSAFGPVILLSLYSKKISRTGALCGMITGGLSAVLWPLIDSSTPPLVVGFAFSLLTSIVVSRITQEVNEVNPAAE